MSENKTYVRKWGISPSQLNDFEGCPKRFKHVKLDKKVPFVETDQIKWGKVVHKALENYVKTKEILPKYLHHLIPVIDGMRANGYQLYAEMVMAVRSDWSACGWWDSDCMYRGMIDLFAVHPVILDANTIDWKTGKRKRDDSQLNLYGTMALSALSLNEVRSWFMWIKSREADPVVVNQSNAQILRNQFATRAKAMDDAYKSGEFPAKASALCAYCPLLDVCDEAAPYRKRARFIKGNR